MMLNYKSGVFLLFILMVQYRVGLSQEIPDSIPTIPMVTVRAFEQGASNMVTAATQQLTRVEDPSDKSSLVRSVNTLAGVTMEERSPGSYRINIRGSSLRAPFGVRNVKIYWGAIPITDPSGNSYFNQFASNSFSTLSVFKGPASSMYGAGTGGLILLEPPITNRPGLGLEYMKGSYGLQNIFFDAAWGGTKNSNALSFAHNQTDGYRQQSNMKRDQFTWTSRLIQQENRQLTGYLLYTNLYYQTPGALTETEFKRNPRSARPAAGLFPSAMDVGAAIWQKNISIGFQYLQQIGRWFKNSTAVYGSYHEVKNSAIRNFERRIEPHFGGRTVFSFESKQPGAHPFQWHLGAEGQQGVYNIVVSNNRQGRADTLQTNDDVQLSNLSVFTQANYSIQAWSFTGGLSMNANSLRFSRLNAYPVNPQRFKYAKELAPRFSVLKKFQSDWQLLAVVSRGFSPPTVSELLPSTTILNTNLQAEHGWNYELTAIKKLLRSRLRLEATAFYFKLDNGLVQKRDASGADYFINAGRLFQKGLELSGHYDWLFNASSWADYLKLQTAYTHNHFKYGRYSKTSMDFSGNWIPGVPMNSLSAQAHLRMKMGWSLQCNYYGVSALYLNDANLDRAKSYHLVTGRLGYSFRLAQWGIQVFGGADNVLNQTYSMGYDINAAAGRYYNAAPKRNYFLGARIQWARRS